MTMKITIPAYTLLLAFVLAGLLAAPLATAQDETWKVNLKNADIREFVTQVSSITGRSFVVDPRVKGNVTVVSSASMDADSVYELFLSVLRVHGYAAVPAGNVTKIVQQVLAKQSGNPADFSLSTQSEELVTSVIPVRNTPSAELVKILRPLIPQYGHISGITKPNALIVSDHAGNIARLVEVIERVDLADTQTIVTIDLQEAWVENMVELLQKLAPDQIGANAAGPNRVNIVASERTNSLILKGEQKTVERVEDLVKRLDVPANRTGATQVIRLAHADAEEMAEILKNIVTDSRTGEQANKRAVSIQPDKALNALVIRADPTTMLELREVIASLDVRRLQVLIEAAIVEVTADFSRELGTELAVGDESSSNLPLGITAPSGTLAQVLRNLALDPTTAIGLGDEPLIAGGRRSVGGTSFALIIRALTTNQDVNLLSTPSITTMQNEEAKIVVGQNVPFRTGSTVTGSQGATNPFTTIQREDVGLTLEVTPHIQDGGLIRLDIHQEVSEVDSSSTAISIGSAGSADLITNKRTIDTTILVDDQEVIIIGGLIRDKETKTGSKVPILGDIPGLGFFFRSRTKRVEKQNLLVFLRPTVLDSKESIGEVTEREFGNTYELEIKGTDIKTAIHDLFDGKVPTQKRGNK